MVRESRASRSSFVRSRPCPARAAQSSRDNPRRQRAATIRRCIGHSGLDMGPELKPMPVLHDFHGADFAGPAVDILEQIPVDRLKAGKAGWHTEGDAIRDQLPFAPVGQSRIARVQCVPGYT